MGMPAAPAPQLDPTSRQIITEIDAYMLSSGVNNSGWYVGITGDINRLFGYHKVGRDHDLWIYRTCPSESAARALEAAYHKAGCRGDTGGGSGDGRCKILYAYRITPTTVE